jgi:hypothetical protein
MRNAIAPTTRKAYDSAVAGFRQWRRDNGHMEVDALPTADEVLTWAAELADRGQLAAASIRGYVSAIGEWYSTHAHPDSNAQNPTQSGSVRRLLDGIERDKHTRVSGQLPTATALPLLYTTLQQFHFDNTPRDRMRRAAAFLGVAGAFRPGELFPSQSGRPLLRGQLQFFHDAAGTQLMCPPDVGKRPQVLEVTLKATKTSQLKTAKKFVWAADAVHFCWQWYCDTATRGADAIFLQEELGGQPLTSYALCKHLEKLHQRAGLGIYSPLPRQIPASGWSEHPRRARSGRSRHRCARMGARLRHVGALRARPAGAATARHRVGQADAAHRVTSAWARARCQLGHCCRCGWLPLSRRSPTRRPRGDMRPGLDTTSSPVSQRSSCGA